MRTHRLLAGAIIMTAAGTALGQTIFFESEPNDSKAEADVFVGLVPLDQIVATPGTTANPNLDYFRVSFAPQPLGMRRYNFQATTANPIGFVIRALAQSDPGPGLGGLIDPASDVAMGSSDWYAFGHEYEAYFTTDTRSFGVAPNQFGWRVSQPSPIKSVDIGAFAAGPINLTVGFELFPGVPSGGEIHVFDDSFHPIPGFIHTVAYDPAKGIDSGGLTRDFEPGTYYIVAYGPFDIATNLPSPADDPYGKGQPVLDFPGMLAIGGPLGFNGFFDTFHVTDAVARRSFPRGWPGWYRMTVIGDPACDPVSIISPPSDASVCDGHDALFEVVAAGTGPFEYQWSGPAGPIPGATSSLLLLPGVTAADAGLYEVTITNDCSQEVAIATLDVHPTGPDITLQPEPAGPLCPGDIAVFSVGAQGHMGGALSYQWYKDCTPISGATSDTLEVLVTGVGDQGQYKVRVTEAGCGSADSFPAMLYVSNEPPQITLNGDAYMVLECGRDSYSELGAQVTDDCDSGLVATISGAVDTHTPGNYELKYDVTDSQGNAAATVSRWVTVADTTPPEVLMAVANPTLWSPNHEMVNVGLVAAAADACDPLGAAASLQIMVFCDESELPETGDGTGKHSPDAKDMGPVTLRLRSERQGKADGRVYIIVGTAMDESGNMGFGFSSVVCPRSSDAADVAAVNAQALAAMDAVAAAAGGLPGDGAAVADALTSLGYQLHGVQPESGPHQ